jgi:hypothetical protein
MRRALKVVAWSLGGVIALIILVGSALYIAANSDSGRVRIENLTARLTGGHVVDRIGRNAAPRVDARPGCSSAIAAEYG